MSDWPVGPDAFTPVRSRATLDRGSSDFTDDAASRASTGINGELDKETLDLRDEVLSTSMFEEIVGSSGRDLRRNRAGDESCSERCHCSDHR